LPSISTGAMLSACCVRNALPTALKNCTWPVASDTATEIFFAFSVTLSLPDAPTLKLPLTGAATVISDGVSDLPGWSSFTT